MLERKKFNAILPVSVRAPLTRIMRRNPGMSAAKIISKLIRFADEAKV